jgi:tryptophan synthase alpha chain
LRRIEKALAELKQAGRGGLIPFITAGDPNLEVTSELIIELARCGASIIELGIPFSDPMADGPVIQRSSERALRNRVGIEEILQTVSGAREHTDVPIVLFSVGVDGVLVTDLAPEEAENFQSALSAQKLAMIYLVAPTSTDDRLQMIAKRAAGFIYAVSSTGISGMRKESSEAAATLVARMRTVTDLPIAVGFGISNKTQVDEVLGYADAAVVGSAIVAEIEKQAGNGDLVKEVGAFVRRLTARTGDYASFEPQRQRREM